MLPTGVAAADCTGAGEFGAGSGCPPPGDSSGSGSSDSWPPTAVDWPPPQNSISGSDDDSGGKGDAATPIVMPNGQKPPPAVHSESTSTSTPAKPIVPVGAASVETTPTEIVAPAP